MKLTTPTPAPPALWCGWTRLDSKAPWRLLIRAAVSEGEAHNKLLAVLGGRVRWQMRVQKATDLDPNEEEQGR